MPGSYTIAFSASSILTTPFNTKSNSSLITAAWILFATNPKASLFNTIGSFFISINNSLANSIYLSSVFSPFESSISGIR